MVDRTIVYRLQADVAAAEANVRHFGSTVRRTADDLTAVSKEGEKSRRALNDIGDTAGKVGLVAAAGIGASVKAAMDWETAWAGVAKTVDGTAGQMAALEDELRGLAKTMPATHQEIAATAEAAGQLGVAREDVAAFTETMLMLGETTNLTSEDAATSIAQFMYVMKTSAADVDEIGNTLVDLGNKGASTEAQILDMAQRLSGAGSLVGATEQDVLALASAMANLGIQSELGGGAIQRVFTGIYQAAANGEEGLAGFADVSGMTAADFADQWANDPIKAFDAFLQGLGRVKESGGNVVGTLDDLGIKGTQNLQVMLRLAGAGDMLTTSLDQSNSAWDKNSALTDEYGKRAETTASQVQVAWNQIKDAGIEAGAVLLPAVAGAANAVGDLATAFGNLPGPVKTGVTGLAGVTAILGGGLWFTAKTVSGIANMRSSLSDLGVTADGTSGKLGGLAKAGAAAAGILTLAAAVTELSNNMAESLPGLETLKGRLIDIGNLPDGFSFSLGPEFDSLGDSIDRLAAPGRLDTVSDKLNSINDALLPGEQYADSAAREAINEIAALDDALAGLASSGNADLAGAALERVLGSLSDSQAEYLLTQLPKYDEALAGVANQSKLTEGATEGMTGATQGLGDAFGTAAVEAEDFGDVVDRLNERLAGRADMRSYQAAIDDFTKSLQENGKTFDINTEKGRNNQAALDNIAGTALKVAENMKGAARQEFLTGAIKDIRTMGNQMGVPKSEIAALIKLLRNANNADVKPKIDADPASLRTKVEDAKKRLDDLNGMKPTPKVDAQTAAAEAKLNDLLAQLREAERDRSSTVTTTFVTNRVVNERGPGPRREADGGHIIGAGTATSDSIPAYLSNGEYVIKAAAVQKYGVHMFDRLNAMHFAKGGEVKKPRKGPKHHGEQTEWIGGPSAEALEQAAMQAAEAAELYYAEQERAQRRESELADERAAHAAAVEEEMRQHNEAVLAGQERAWEQATADSQARVDLAQQELDAVESSMERIGQAAIAAFDSDLFGTQQHGLSASGHGSGWRGALAGDIAGLEERAGLITQLAGQGLSGAALETLLGQSDNAGIAAMLANGEVGDYAAMFAQRAALQQQVAQQAGVAGYGAEHAAASAVVAQATAQLAALTAAIEAARPITVLESVSAQATAQELARLLSMTGAA